MKVNDYLKHSIDVLAAAGIATARLDCLVLLEDVLNTNRTHILAHPERHITEVEKQKLDTMIQKRRQHVPLAYIRGKTEFYGREFSMTDQVLEPRPESETMIDILKSLPAPQRQTIIDVGTGSGALAITAALELPGSQVMALDIDANCRKLARLNARQHAVAVQVIKSDLLLQMPNLQDQPTVLLCNLPYVPDNFHINTAAGHEPRLAIFGGPDGLAVFRRLFQQLRSRGSDNIVVLSESLPPQHPELTQVARAAGFRLVAEQDFVQAFERQS